MTHQNELIHLPHYHNVIVDLDGTLVDSNDAHCHAFMDAFEENGIHHLSFPEIRKLIGMSSDFILSYVLDEAVFQEKGHKIDADRVHIFETRYLQQVQVFPGVLPLFELFKAHGLHIAVSTASPPSVVKHFIEKLDIQSLIEGITTNEDVPEGKPRPVAIEACCEKFGFTPTKTIMIGDSPYDIIAAAEFLIQTIAVLTGGYTQEELQKTGAVAIYKDLKEMYEAYAKPVLSQ